MSNENIQSNATSSAASYLTFPAITTGVGALNSIKRNHGVKNAIAACRRQDFVNLQGKIDADCFTKATTLAENYEHYNSLAKKASKLAKKASKKDISIFQKFFNLFRSQDKKVTIDTIKKNSSEAQKLLNSATENLKEGKFLIKETTEKGLKNNAAKFFKNEIKNPIVIAMTALEAVPEITSKIIPTFKEKGFVEGIKQTGKSILKIGSNFLSFAAGSALGRIAGAAIGSIICPGAGSALGAKIGDMIGGMFIGSNVTKVVNKVIGENEQTTEINETQNIPQENINDNNKAMKTYNA